MRPESMDQNLQRPAPQMLIYPVASGNANQTSDLLLASLIKALPITYAGAAFYLAQTFEKYRLTT
jgi:hypothetical protein